MSTKIYNGYKLPDMSLRELNNWMKHARNILQPIAQRLYSELVIEKSTSILDMKSIYQDAKERIEKKYNRELTKYTSASTLAIEFIRKKRANIRSTNERDPEYDYEMKICVIPIKNYILLLLYTEQEVLRTCFEKLPQIQWYPYWNNTDPDEECTEKEWEQRKNDWDEALPDLGIPYQNGVIFKLVDDTYMIPRNLNKYTNELQYSFDQRVEKWAYKLTMNKVIKRLVEEGKAKGTYDPMDLEPYFIARKYLKTIPGKGELENESDRIALLLKSKYTCDDIFEVLYPELKTKSDTKRRV